MERAAEPDVADQLDIPRDADDASEVSNIEVAWGDDELPSIPERVQLPERVEQTFAGASSCSRGSRCAVESPSRSAHSSRSFFPLRGFLPLIFARFSVVPVARSTVGAAGRNAGRRAQSDCCARRSYLRCAAATALAACCAAFARTSAKREVSSASKVSLSSADRLPSTG